MWCVDPDAQDGLFVAAPWSMVYPVSPDYLQMRWPRRVMSVRGRILRVKAVENWEMFVVITAAFSSPE